MGNTLEKVHKITYNTKRENKYWAWLHVREKIKLINEIIYMNRHECARNLQSHDASQIHLQAVCGLQDSLFVFYPRQCLTALNVEWLHSMGRIQLITFSFSLLPKFSPFMIQLDRERTIIIYITVKNFSRNYVTCPLWKYILHTCLLDISELHAWNVFNPLFVSDKNYNNNNCEKL